MFHTSGFLQSNFNNYLVFKLLIIYICLTMKAKSILTLLNDVIVEV